MRRSRRLPSVYLSLALALACTLIMVQRSGCTFCVVMSLTAKGWFPTESGPSLERRLLWTTISFCTLRNNYMGTTRDSEWYSVFNRCWSRRPGPDYGEGVTCVTGCRRDSV